MVDDTPREDIGIAFDAKTLAAFKQFTKNVEKLNACKIFNKIPLDSKNPVDVKIAQLFKKDMDKHIKIATREFEEIKKLRVETHKLSQSLAPLGVRGSMKLAERLFSPFSGMRGNSFISYQQRSGNIRNSIAGKFERAIGVGVPTPNIHGGAMPANPHKTLDDFKNTMDFVSKIFHPNHEGTQGAPKDVINKPQYESSSDVIKRKVSKWLGKRISGLHEMKEVFENMNPFLTRQRPNTFSRLLSGFGGFKKFIGNDSDDEDGGGKKKGGLLGKLGSAGGIMAMIGGGGLIGMIGKKLFDASPMLQAMMKILNTSFTLILRPIGDFIGGFLRPITLFFMREIAIPFMRSGKGLMDMGEKIGTNVLGWILKPAEMLEKTLVEIANKVLPDWMLGGEANVDWYERYDPIKDWKLDTTLDTLVDKINEERGKLDMQPLSKKVLMTLKQSNLGINAQLSKVGNTGAITSLYTKFVEAARLKLTADYNDKQMELLGIGGNEGVFGKFGITVESTGRSLSELEEGALRVVDVFNKFGGNGKLSLLELEQSISKVLHPEWFGNRPEAITLGNFLEGFGEEGSDSYEEAEIFKEYIEKMSVSAKLSEQETKMILNYFKFARKNGITTARIIGEMGELFEKARDSLHNKLKELIGAQIRARSNKYGTGRPDKNLVRTDDALSKPGTYDATWGTSTIYNNDLMPTGGVSPISKPKSAVTGYGSVGEIYNLQQRWKRITGSYFPTPKTGVLGTAQIKQLHTYLDKKEAGITKYGGKDTVARGTISGGVGLVDMNGDGVVDWRDYIGTAEELRRATDQTVRYAEGGIINEPIFGIGRSGRQYLMGENGREVITPEKKSGGSVFNIININIGNVTKEADYTKLKTLVQRWILEANSRRGII